MFSSFGNEYLYTLVEMQRQLIKPYRQIALMGKDFHNNFFSGSKLGRSIGASYEMFERLTRNYPKPEFNIKHTTIAGKNIKIKEQELLNKTFCRLLHFKKSEKFDLPKILIVAPMSGHHATLLRGTVEGLLPYFDVYITDWTNACDIPKYKGPFRFDDFVNYVIEFLTHIGQHTNVMAVCQPAVPVAAAVSLLAKEKSQFIPDSMILMGGPIDTRKNPTEVNDYAAERTIHWFEQNVITKVPSNYDGAGRSVYPGFTQLFGFMAMNLQTHMEAHWDLFNHLVEGDGDSISVHKKFYNEYLSVMDLPAEFYLETVNLVFKKHLLPRGKLVCNGKTVSLADIEKTAVLCVEGERDDISGIGQTKAALTLCKNLADRKKKYHLQKGVGHYGIFNGRRYRESVVPVIKEFVYKHTQTPTTKPKSTTKSAPKKAKPATAKKTNIVPIKTPSKKTTTKKTTTTTTTKKKAPTKPKQKTTKKT